MASGSKRVVYAALAGNLAIAITKFIAAAITGSSAMLSEGVHSVVDTGNQALLLYGMRRAQVPADERFPFGRGKEIKRLARTCREIERVNEVLTMHVGPEYILANISVDIACDVPRSRAHAIMDELDARIKEGDPRVKRVFIESQNVC